VQEIFKNILEHKMVSPGHSSCTTLAASGHEPQIDDEKEVAAAVAAPDVSHTGNDEPTVCGATAAEMPTTEAAEKVLVTSQLINIAANDKEAYTNLVSDKKDWI